MEFEIDEKNFLWRFCAVIVLCSVHTLPSQIGEIEKLSKNYSSVIETWLLYITHKRDKNGQNFILKSPLFDEVCLQMGGAP